MRTHSSRHGTTRSISARNCARRVIFVYFSNPAPASVGWERVIVTSRSRVRLLVASQHNSRESERLIQRFLSGDAPKTCSSLSWLVSAWTDTRNCVSNFAGWRDVRIILDRREGDRRTVERIFSGADHRRVERRRRLNVRRDLSRLGWTVIDTDEIVEEA